MDVELVNNVIVIIEIASGGRRGIPSICISCYRVLICVRSGERVANRRIVLLPIDWREDNNVRASYPARRESGRD